MFVARNYCDNLNFRGANMWQPKVGCGNSLLQPKKNTGIQLQY